jgi:hypothetical protein
MESIKQWVDPESTRAKRLGEESEIDGDEREMRREFGSERADALRRTTSGAQEEPTQSSTCAEAWGLLRLFSNLRQAEYPSLWPVLLWLSWPWLI